MRQGVEGERQWKNWLNGRLTNLWAASIRHSILELQDLHQMENKRSFYLKPDEWAVWLEDAFVDRFLRNLPGGQSWSQGVS